MSEQGQARNWNQTALWSELQNRTSGDAGIVCAALATKMPQIEKILAVGGTAPLDFTLHDAEHSFRVAERMSQIIPTDSCRNCRCTNSRYYYSRHTYTTSG